MASVLELCPFCDSRNLQVAHQLFSYAVSCQACKARGPSKKTFKLAVIEWNHTARSVLKGRQRREDYENSRTHELEATIRHLVSQLG